jgi:predicted permease
MQDLHLAVRSLRATPVVTTVAVLSLALGIGANTAIFSIVDGLFLRALPVRDPRTLVGISDTATRGIQYWDYRVWTEVHNRHQLFDGTAALASARLTLTTEGQTEALNGIWASGSYFEILGVPAWLGRTFTDDDDRIGGGRGPVMVVSYSFWQRHFGGDRNAVGRFLILNGTPVTILGVTPPDFFGTEIGRSLDVMLPISVEPMVNGRDSALAGEVLGLQIFARLKPRQSPAMAMTSLRAIQAQIREAARPQARLDPRLDPSLRDYLKDPFTVIPVPTGTSLFRRRYQQPLVTILMVSACVLLVACANIATLLLARATSRRRELSVRLAIGASRWRLARQLLVESSVLAGAGAIAAIFTAVWASRLLVHKLSTQITPIDLDLSIDTRVLAFTVVIVVTCIVLFGGAPAWRASQVAPMEALKAHDRGVISDGNRRFVAGLIIGQVALSVILIVGAGLLIRTFISLEGRDPGFSRDRLLIVRVDGGRAIADPADRLPTYGRVLDAVRAAPEVASAALTGLVPVSDLVFDPPVDISGTGPLSSRDRQVWGNQVSSGWFRTLGIPVVAGRDFAETDRPGTLPVVVVNLAFSRRFFSRASPLGQTITLPALMTAPRPPAPMTIVGVVADAVYVSLREPPTPTMYLPIAQHNDPYFQRALGSANLIVRAENGSPTRLAKSITAAVTSVNAQLALQFRPLADQLDDSLARERVTAVLASFFGLLALLLAALGLYGVTAYSVAQRRTEIGIRMALGSAPWDVVRLVMSRVTLLVGIGIMVGAGMSLWTSKFVGSLLYGLEPRDPATLVVAAVILATVGAVAGWLPAWRASRIDPAEALREA